MPGRGVDRLLVVIEIASAAAAALIVAFQGVDEHVLGVRISARNASRALLIFSCAFLLHAWFRPAQGNLANRFTGFTYARWGGKFGAAAWAALGAALGLADLASLGLTHPDLFAGWRDLLLTGTGAILLHAAVFALLAPAAAALAWAVARDAKPGRAGLALFPLAATLLLAGQRSVWSLPAGSAGNRMSGIVTLAVLALAGWGFCRVLPGLLARLPVPVSLSAAGLLLMLAGLAAGVRGDARGPEVSRAARGETASGRAAPPGDAAEPVAEPNLLLISVDTLRADRLGCYGNGTVRTPHMDAIAAGGVRCETAVCTIPETGPSHLSILDGRLPRTHGARANGQKPLPGPSLAPLLRARGYRTGAVVSGYTLKAALAGTAEGFDSYDEHFSPFAGMTGLSLVAWLQKRGAVSYVTLWEIWAERRGDATTGRAIGWLRQADPRPFFLWVHYFDPHGPYDPPPPFDRMYYQGDERDPANRSMDGVEIIHRHQEMPGVTDIAFHVARYDGEVTWTDEQVGALLEELTIAGLAQSTVVVLVADHGESLTEHGYHFAHGGDLFEPSVRVPLLFRGPGVARGGVLRELVSTVDIAPTVLDLLAGGRDDRGAALLGTIDGRSIAAALRPTTPEPEQPGVPADLARAAPELLWAAGPPPAWIEGEVTSDRGGIHFDDPVAGKLVAIRTQDFKIVRTPSARDALFDLRRDPGELEDVAASHPRLARFLAARLDEGQAKGTAAGGQRTLTEEEKQILESLGYAGR